jgi:hypothetical protein
MELGQIEAITLAAEVVTKTRGLSLSDAAQVAVGQRPARSQRAKISEQ